MTPPLRTTALALLLTALVAASACAEPPASAGADGRADTPTDSGAIAAYDFASPVATVNLAADLMEISALSYRPDGRLAAVHDEEGILYTIEPSTGAIVGQRRFAGAGDFEGVEWAEGGTWVLRSNGSLHVVPDSGGVVEEFNTPLRANCDAEGLAYDTMGRALLIACKEQPGQGLEGTRAVYAFDLRTRTLGESPVLLIDRRQVDAAGQFKPSALAIHPTTRQVYIVSSVRKAIVVLEPNGTFVSLTELPSELYSQPEGLAFAPDGTLYISNEGVGGSATLLRFDPRP